MTKEEALIEIRRGNAMLRGTTRPTASVQIDRYIIYLYPDEITVMVTTGEQWDPKMAQPKFVAHSYEESKLIRVERLTELK